MECRKIRISRKMTVGQWLERTVYDLKFPVRLKPTSNYQVYVSLYHKLQREGSIINIPVNAVSDATFRQLIRWLRSSRQPNFLGTMQVFTSLINRARSHRLTRYHADFPYRNFAPKSSKAVSALSLIDGGGTVKSLTPEQWSAFLSFDLSLIRLHGGPHLDYWKEVYRDFCILLYELKSRPVDVLQLHSSGIAFHEPHGRFLCSYVPAKKRNSDALVVQFLSPEAVKVVEKYRGRSKGGYVLPFPLNERRWNLDVPAQFHDHYRAACCQLWKVNKFLHLVGQALGLPFRFTLYAVRRSALTHALMEGRIPVTVLAKIAGTSVRMIEKHYTNYLHTLAQY